MEAKIQKIARFLGFHKAVLLMLLLLSAWAPIAHADAFAGVVENERLTLTCDGPAVVNAPCRIEMGSTSNTMPVRFTAPGTSYRYPHLLKQGLEKVLEDKKHPLRPSDSDIRLLRSLDLDKCFPGDKLEGLSGDIVQLCVPTDRSRIVLFMRGLCDHCDFVPIVLKKNLPQ